MARIEDYPFPSGLHLLSRWQSGDAQARRELTEIFDAAIAGDFDASFAVPVPSNEIHATASVHMLALSVLHDLYGIESAEYYKTDPRRYVRANLTVSRLLGVKKPYMTWALYAFTCEPLGQTMMYPDRFPPGCDPDAPLINKDNWWALETPDFTTGVPKAIDDIMRVTEEITGMAPLLQISAPYSLAADIYGQEPLLADVVDDPDHVNALLDHLADKVLGPWMDHHIETFPNGWIELSDASGSPFFIGAQNCKNMSIRAIQYMIKNKPYADRVYDNNYRGDYVAQVTKKARGSRRRPARETNNGGIGLLELTEAKVSVCPGFIMRLEADKVDISFYADQSIQRNLPLTAGIGSPQIDRNSIGNLEDAKAEITDYARSCVESIKRVCETIDLPEDNFVMDPWPSHIYFEDVNSQSQFELVELVLNEVKNGGRFQPNAHPLQDFAI
ncbi:MAG: hypothetical protein GY896_02240 [Gammaproteobacteria bacterium]|nr:hypothetical protein [Gammaproteobacteria bacterium]